MHYPEVIDPEKLSAESEGIQEGQPLPVRPPKQPPQRPWLAILGVALLSASLGWGANGWLASRKLPPPSGAMASQGRAVPVKLAAVEEGTLEQRSELVGTLEARRSIAVQPEIDGRVVEILVGEGDRVRQGQVLARLDGDTLEAELRQAKAELASAQAKLAELRAGTRPEEIAQARAQLNQARARLADARGGARPEAIAQAQAQLDAARAEADLAQQRVSRYRALQAEGAISIDGFEQYLKEERKATAAVREAQRRLAELRKGRGSDMDGLAAEVERARANLTQLENGARQEEIARAMADVERAGAQVRNAEVKLQKTQLLAPFSGIVGDIPVKVGDYVSEGDALTTLTDNGVLELDLSVPLERASALRPGLPVEILDGSGKAMARGRISFVSPTVNPNAQVVLAKATFQNVGGDLADRQLVPARVIWGQRPGILVPVTAISRIGGRTFAFVAEPSGQSPSGEPQFIARQTAVKLGDIQGNSYQVLEGLEVGDKIVVAGQLNLKDGASMVSAKPSLQQP